MSVNESLVSSVENEIAVLKSQNYVNDKAADELAYECRRLADDGVRHFIVNMQDSKMVNSVGIAIVIEMIEDAIDNDGSFSFCRVSPTIAKTFQIMGLRQLSTIYETEEEAVGAVG
jgi:anti-anti-sigma factor